MLDVSTINFHLFLNAVAALRSAFNSPSTATVTSPPPRGFGFLNGVCLQAYCYPYLLAFCGRYKLNKSILVKRNFWRCVLDVPSALRLAIHLSCTQKMDRIERIKFHAKQTNGKIQNEKLFAHSNVNGIRKCQHVCGWCCHSRSTVWELLIFISLFIFNCALHSSAESR